MQSRYINLINELLIKIKNIDYQLYKKLKPLKGGYYLIVVDLIKALKQLENTKETTINKIGVNQLNLLLQYVIYELKNIVRIIEKIDNKFGDIRLKNDINGVNDEIDFIKNIKS